MTVSAVVSKEINLPKRRTSIAMPLGMAQGKEEKKTVFLSHNTTQLENAVISQAF